MRYLIVAPNGIHYMPFEGCSFLELPEYMDEHFDMDEYVKEYAPKFGMKITAEIDGGEVIES